MPNLPRGSRRIALLLARTLAPAVWVRESRDALRARGFPVEYTEIPGRDHSYERYSKVSDVNRQMWDFLKAQKLPSDPGYTAYGEER